MPNNIIHPTRATIVLFQRDHKRAGDDERSKDVSFLMGASKAALQGRSQEATVDAWLKSARQSGSSDGLRVSVI
jgi:hypothetical protein